MTVENRLRRAVGWAIQYSDHARRLIGSPSSLTFAHGGLERDTAAEAVVLRLWLAGGEMHIAWIDAPLSWGAVTVMLPDWISGAAPGGTPAQATPCLDHTQRHRGETAGLILQQRLCGVQGMAFARWVCRNYGAAVTRRGSLWRCDMLGLIADSPTSAEIAILAWCDRAACRGGAP